MKRNGILIGLCVIVAGLIGACGGSVDEDNNGVGGTGGTAGTGGTGSAGTEAGGTAGSGSGGVAGTSASDDLSGTWDVLATPMGDITVAGTLVLDDSQLTVSTDDFSFDFRAGDSPTLAWRSEGQETPIVVNNTPTEYPLGAIPLDLGGSWNLRQGHGGCDLTLSEGAGVLANCWDVEAPGELPRLDGQMTGVRVSERSSMFGRLGGVWQFSNQEGWSCQATVEERTVSATCQGAVARYNGSMTIEFGDGIASGSTNKGLEFSATKR